MSTNGGIMESNNIKFETINGEDVATTNYEIKTTGLAHSDCTFEIFEINTKSL